MTVDGFESNEIDIMGLRWMSMVKFVKEMRLDAIRQAKKAFENGREQIFLAMAAIGEIILYARAEGLIALAKDEAFRTGPYVVDFIEEKQGCKVPLRLFLELGLEHISNGESVEDVAELMVNKYIANGYLAEDALTAYIYCIGVIGIAYGIPFAQMLEYFGTCLPDSETAAFETFAEDKRKEDCDRRYQYMCRKLEEKFSKWDMENRHVVEIDKYGIRPVFINMLGSMDDESLQELMHKICNQDICYALMGADGELRKRVVGLFTKEHKFLLMENWMNIPFAIETVEKCMEAMGQVIRIRLQLQEGNKCH